jgi:hypothetical protein
MTAAEIDRVDRRCPPGRLRGTRCHLQVVQARVRERQAGREPLEFRAIVAARRAAVADCWALAADEAEQEILEQRISAVRRAATAEGDEDRGALHACRRSCDRPGTLLPCRERRRRPA